jgi:two-component system response regulator HydG
MHDGVLREAGPATAMVRDRGAAMLGAFVEGLGTGDVRATRARFEQVVRDHLGVAFVRFRECGSGATPVDVDPALAVTRISSGGRTFALEIPRPTRAAQDQAWHALVCTAGQIGAIVAEIERTAGYRVAVSSLADRDGNRLHGSSPQIQAVRQQIDRVARTDFTVLIEGESGVGKELVARQIHQWSRRNRVPFVAVNCAAIVESLLEAELFGIEDRTATGVRGRRGKLEQAHGGSLFLDEVADLSLAAQAKLLRVLQEYTVERVGGHQSKRVDIRIMAATNRSLSALVAKGQFRGDLYYRLNALELKVPPLRTRREDIIDLAHGCLERHAGVGPCRLSAAALEALLTYEWPGNVRELERVIERAITLCEGEEIQLSDLPPALTERYAIVQPATEGSESMRAWGSRYARLVLERCNNNKRQACRVLDISYHTLQAYLRYTPKLRGAQRSLKAPDGPDGRMAAPETEAGDRVDGGAPVPVLDAAIVAE